MEIIKKARQLYKFRVCRPFMKAGKVVGVGEEVELSEADQVSCVVHGRVIPCDLPSVSVYIALRPFILPGKTGRFEAKVGELVSLKAEDALPLMLSAMVIPKDETRWRPANRRLKK